ncbi:hypothetical protein F5Y05DRAFT_293892 [Hypoxylon sp. FL0543]|nr:hypothetical protein F5Y05DRAFT_293892 [Hypoxylon sp. FL0543]
MHLLPPEPRKDGIYVQMGPAHLPYVNSFDSLVDLAQSDFQQPPEPIDHHVQFQSDDAISLDTRRLQAQHTTEGYRDGITAGKAESIQVGFDEGFSLGAHVGLKAGQILGLLEGVAGALKESGYHGSTRLDQLLSHAKGELSTDSIFSEQYWTSDGSWRYTVKGLKGGNEILFEDLAAEHPIIMKWDTIVRREIERWCLDENLPVLVSGVPRSKVEDSANTTQTASRQAIAW